MWIIQEPNKLALRNKLHFEEKKSESIEHFLKYSISVFVERIYKMQRLEVSGAVRPIYGSLGVQRLTIISILTPSKLCLSLEFFPPTKTLHELRSINPVIFYVLPSKVSECDVFMHQSLYFDESQHRHNSDVTAPRRSPPPFQYTSLPRYSVLRSRERCFLSSHRDSDVYLCVVYNSWPCFLAALRSGAEFVDFVRHQKMIIVMMVK